MTCGKGSHGDAMRILERDGGKRGTQGPRDRGEAARQGEAWRRSSNHEMLGSEFQAAGSRDTARRASRVHHLCPGIGRVGSD